MRKLLILFTPFPLIAMALIGALVAGCTQQQTQATLAAPVPVAVTTNAQTALDSYQAALGVAQIALRGNPALLAKVTALQQQAAPYVAAAQSGVEAAQAAPSLAALAAQLLITGAPYITAVPNNK